MLAGLFFASTLACIVLIARVPSNHTFLVWLPFALMMQLGFLAVLYGVLVLLGIGFTLYLGIFSNVLLIVILGIRFKKPDEEQGGLSIRWSLPSSTKKICEGRDIAAWIIVLLICIACYFAQFGFPPMISFMSSDAAAYTSASFALAQGEVEGAQYLSHLFTGSLMACFDAFIDRETSYMVFELSEAILLFLSGVSLYSLCAALCQKLSSVPLCVLVALYVVGYPLNNMIFGFSYLGLSVTCICILLFTCVATSVSRCSLQRACAASILLYELIISYSLFVPPIYLGVFVLFVMEYRKKGYGVGRSLMALIGIFAIPVCFGYLIVYSSYFVASDVAVGTVIAIEGGATRDLYANFIFIAPLSIYGFVCNIKEQRSHALSVLTAVFCFYVAALFILCALELVSTYYYYKLYYVVWLLLFANAACGVGRLMSDARLILVSYALVWGSLFLFAFTGFDAKLNAARPNLNPTPIAKSWFPVYSFNAEYIDLRRMSEGTMELLHTARDMQDAGGKVACTSNEILLRWWDSVFSNGSPGFKWWGFTDEGLIDKLKEYDYALVSYDDPLLKTQSGSTYLEVLNNAGGYDLDDPENVVFSNESGMIVKTPR